MIEIDAFQPFTVTHEPSTALYGDRSYRSDRAYTDASGDRWTYAGMSDGTQLWSRTDERAAWSITAVVDQFGPLTDTTP